MSSQSNHFLAGSRYRREHWKTRASGILRFIDASALPAAAAPISLTVALDGR
jgi:hypothetical protein